MHHLLTLLNIRLKWLPPFNQYPQMHSVRIGKSENIWAPLECSGIGSLGWGSDCLIQRGNGKTGKRAVPVPVCPFHSLYQQNLTWDATTLDSLRLGDDSCRQKPVQDHQDVQLSFGCLLVNLAAQTIHLISLFLNYLLPFLSPSTCTLRERREFFLVTHPASGTSAVNSKSEGVWGAATLQTKQDQEETAN